ncbi:MAG: c-type cytochrome biogenesis protein CcmI [Roseovarius sp.]|nr:c-type cytochrome biogenesis protein CcmI [Roseovarius sp.]
MTFWIIIAATALLAGAILGITLIRGRTGAAPPAAYDLQVYRDQLKEVDRDLARGVIGEEDAERLRAEVSRRVLAADAQLRDGGETGGQPTRGSGTLLASLLAAIVAGGSLLLYDRLGAPGASDLPLAARIAASDTMRANRLTQAEAEAQAPPLPADPQVNDQFLQLMDRLRETVAQRPDDIRGLTLLMQNEARLGNMGAAREAQERVIAAKGAAATADDYATLADIMISAAGGYVSREAEQALRTALQRDASNPRARYYLGLYLLQVDRPDGAFRTWSRLLEESPPDAPWAAPIRSRIEDVAWRAGVTDYQLPAPGQTAPADPGPGAADIEAAQDMTDEDRQAMIRGMVQRLSDRLARDGGTAAEWSRLIVAYGVLGDTDSAKEAWQAAQDAHGDDPDALTTLRRAARDAGLVE